MKTLIAAILGLFVMTTAATAQVGVFVGPNGGVGVFVGPGGFRGGGYYDDGGMPGWRGTSQPYFYNGPQWGGPRFWAPPRWRGNRWDRRGWRGNRWDRRGWRGNRWHGSYQGEAPPVDRVPDQPPVVDRVPDRPPAVDDHSFKPALR